MTTTQVLPTTNPAHGFYGESVDLARTVAQINGAVADPEYLTAAANARWSEVCEGLMLLGYSPLIAQRLLDCRWGRHLADWFEQVPTCHLRTQTHYHINTLKGRAFQAFNEALAVANDEEHWA